MATKTRSRTARRLRKDAGRRTRLVKAPTPNGVKRTKWVYYFGKTRTDGSREMKALLGGKGANLAAMTAIGLPVPPGFTITTEVCTAYYAAGKKLPKGLLEEVQKNIAMLAKETGKRFGDMKSPLLVAVRSGARDSMPGMMDTILNLGLNDQTVEALKNATANGRFAWDCYRRFVQMYGDVVMGVQKHHENDPEPFEEVMEELKHHRGVHEDTELNEGDLRELVNRYKKLIRKRTGQEFPADPIEQLKGAVGAVPVMDERARDPLSRQVQDSRRVGHGRQHSVDGLREHGR
jgi:pyruvate, orthophosphate dikinase